MEDNEEALRELAKKLVQAKFGFITHAAMYAFVAVGLVVMWTMSGRGGRWAVWLMLAWGAALIAHAVVLFIGPGTRAEERAIAREMRRVSRRPHAV